LNRRNPRAAGVALEQAGSTKRVSTSRSQLCPLEFLVKIKNFISSKSGLTWCDYERSDL